MLFVTNSIYNSNLLSCIVILTLKNCIFNRIEHSTLKKEIWYQMKVGHTIYN